MTAKKSTAQKSPVTLAKEYIKEVESSISALAAELEPLQAEHDVLAEKGLLTPTDLDRLDGLESLISRRSEHLEKLRSVTLPGAVAELRRLELLDLAADGVNGIEAKYAEYQRRIAEAEQKAAQALTDAREAAQDWDRFIGHALTAAQQAGQEQSNPIDPEHPVRVTIGTLYPEKNKPTHLIVGGRTYQAVSIGGVVRAVAAKADPDIAELIRLGAEEMTYSEVRRGRWS